MRILAIDPGTVQSGFVVWEDKRVRTAGIVSNPDILEMLELGYWSKDLSADLVAIEMVESYGMAVGKEVFRTVWWTGRFAQEWKVRTGNLPMEIFRKDVKLHLCGTTKAKDQNIRQALIDLIGHQGTKKSPGPTYGVSSHMWAALAVAVTAENKIRDSDG